jgi:hypothetical protein
MIVLIAGRKGQGKSTLGLYLATYIQKKQGAHVIPIFDPKYTYKNVPSTSDPEEFSDLLERSGFSAVAYRPLPPGTASEVKSESAMQEEFANFMEAISIECHLGREASAARKNMGTVVVIVDEAWFLQAGNSIDPWLDTLVRLSDSKRLYLILMAHRPSDFSTRVRAQADELYFFQQVLPADLEAIRNMAGDEVAERVAALPLHHVLRYNVADNKAEVWDFPEGWFMAIHPSPPANTVQEVVHT